MKGTLKAPPTISTNTDACAIEAQFGFFFTYGSNVSVCTTTRSRVGRVFARIIINEERNRNHLFLEKDFYRQKGACVTSGGIFIDLSGVLRFSFGLFLCVILDQAKKIFAKRTKNLLLFSVLLGITRTY